MRARRIGVGTTVTLLDGQGGKASGVVRALARRNATIEVQSVEAIAAPPAVHALVPVADRDRMLWLAEKSAELALTSWRPVQWKRSRSVMPRGEGSAFHGKLVGRMASALEQSGNAWLPVTFPESTLERSIASLPAGARLALDAGGEPIVRALRDLRDIAAQPVTIAIGPEGGLEDSERNALDGAGFRRVSLGATILRFETAGVAALAHVRAALSELEAVE
jgi:16S rRNA (uracil1498-N3)-methyltransferase